MSRSNISLAGFIWLLTACTSHTSGPEVAPYPSQPKPAETTAHTSSTNTTWEFIPSEQSHIYRSTSYTVVHEVSTTKPRVDTLKLNTHFSINLNQLQNPTTISGYIDSATVAQNSGLTSQLNNPQSRIGLTGEIEGGEVRLKLSADQGECSSPITPILGEIRPLITTHSKALSLTSAWTDSISAVTCSGSGIPTTLKIVRSYRVLGEETYSATQVLLIERIEATNFNGSGSQEQHQVEIKGIGIGTSRIYLDRTTGATVAVESTQKIDTIIRSSGRLQHFIQNITQKIELVP